MEYIALDDFIKAALLEDIGTGDITTQSCVPVDAVSVGRFVAKEPFVLCGMPVLSRVFFLLDARVKVTPLCADGDKLEKGAVLAEISGPSRSILTGERVALNLIQRLSGIATKTAKAVVETKEYKVKIADTRKTTPGLRFLEKYAVKTGGGTNHRFNLADGVLIKDNHIVAAGGIKNAVANVRRSAPHTLKIEVETENFMQIDEALAAGADIIMLDNMSLADMAEAVRRIGGRALTEASGNMGDRDLIQVAATGVDLISIGALTHTVIVADISLKFYEN